MGYRSFMHALGLLLLATTVTVAANDHVALEQEGVAIITPTIMALKYTT